MPAVVSTNLTNTNNNFPAEDDNSGSIERHQRQPSHPAFTKSSTTQGFMHSRTMSTDVPTGADRWRLNAAGQLVGSEAAADWEISDQLMRMKIGASDEGPRNGQTRTPPNSKRTTSAVMQMAEASPFDTSSDASGTSSSPDSGENKIGLATHSREASTDSNGSSRNLRVPNIPPMTPPQVGIVGEHRERPHSYSGGLSMADLRRLQQTGSPVAKPQSGETTPQQPTRDWASPIQTEQPSFPSLTGNPAILQRPAPIQTHASPANAGIIHPPPQEDDGPVQFGGLPQAGVGGASGPNRSPPNNAPYRPPVRTQVQTNPVPQVAPVPPNSAGFQYPGQPQPGLSLGNAQQMYDMMLPGMSFENPALARVQQQQQQQQTAFRPAHQHSTSDPSSLREAATLAQLLAANNVAFGGAPGMYPGLPAAAPHPLAAALYANQFYAPQDVYQPNDLVAQAQLMAKLQAQLTGQYGVALAAQNLPLGGNISPQMLNLSPNGTGPSANNRKLGLYKTELCRSWEEKGTCRYGAKCQFAHGEDDLRPVARHPKYKTEICRTFWVSGSCPYGKRCCFIHTELPAGGAPPGADGTPPPAVPDTRPRGGSVGSDQNDGSTSLLARISAKRNSQQLSGPGSAAPTPIDTTPQSSSFNLAGRPGSLRVDTSTFSGAVAASKENKSAYPSFPIGGLMMAAAAPEPPSAMSPIAVTAHPDFGRPTRLDLHSQTTPTGKPAAPSPNNRHSFNGTDINLDLSDVPTPTTTLNMSPPQLSTRPAGHMRSGSAGNWPSAPFRGSRLAAPQPYSSIPGNELKNNSPWAASELAIGSSRLS